MTPSALALRAEDPLALVTGTDAKHVVGDRPIDRLAARGFRNRHNYRLRMLLIGGGLSDPRL